MVSRSEYLNVKDREEFQSTGVYVLVGPNEQDPSIMEIYIGEGDVVHKRIVEHLAKLDFWTEVIAFTKSDGTLNKAHIRYLEGSLIARARKAKRYRVENSTSPAPPVPDEPTKADLDAFLEEMLVIYRLLGVDAFDEPSPSIAAADEVLTLSIVDVNGIGERTTEGFLVRAGSRASAKEKAMSDGYKSLRKGLLDTGVLVPNGDSLEFTQDFHFSSSSAAASVLYGGSLSGPEMWRYSNGESIKDRDQKPAEELKLPQEVHEGG